MRRVLVWTLRFLILLSLVWLAAQGRQWLLRRRAERLLADIKSLDLNHSSWSEAQTLMSRWGKWGGWNGRCDAQDCSYSIESGYDLFDDRLRAYEGGPHLRARLIDAVGLRSTVVFAGFGVSGGKVTSRSFGLSVTSPIRDWGAPKYRPSLNVEFSEGPALWYDNPHFLASRPNRAFFLRRDRLVAAFTPEESPEEQAALMNFKLDCITSWSPCESHADLLPKADQEFEAQGNQARLEEANRAPTARSNPHAPTCFPTVELRARQEHSVLIGDVVRATTVPAPWEEDRHTIWQLDVRLLKVLKGNAPGPEGSIISVYERGDTGRIAVDDPWPFPKVLITGNTGEGWETHDPVFYAGDCGTLEATPENIAAAKQGVALDFGHRH